MSNKLRDLREKLGLSQQALSNLLNISMQTVWRYEHPEGHPEWEPAIGYESLLHLVSLLSKGKVPDWCKEAKKASSSAEFLSKHVKGCSECRLVLHHLNSVAK